MRTNLRDYEMEYEDKGNGIPLIFIHGYPLNKTMWEAQLQALSTVARVITPDLRGHGGSEPVQETYTMRSMAKDIKELIENLNIEQPVVLCGLSMGGYICFEFMRNYSNMVKGMILAATRATADSIEVKVNREEAVAIALEKGPLAIANMMLPKMLATATYAQKPALVERVRNIMVNTSTQAIVGDLRGMLNREDSTSLLKEIDIPVLILHGAEDQIIPKSEVDLMKNGIKNVKLQIIPAAGHLLNIEQPDLFNKAVRNFIQAL
ncbi:MAG: alpha/beta hydrolase [Anaerolineales bacterium]|jgi:3-oxoadipate enol-lactonase